MSNPLLGGEGGSSGALRMNLPGKHDPRFFPASRFKNMAYSCFYFSGGGRVSFSFLRGPPSPAYLIYILINYGLPAAQVVVVIDTERVEAAKVA